MRVRRSGPCTVLHLITVSSSSSFSFPRFVYLFYVFRVPRDCIEHDVKPRDAPLSFILPFFLLNTPSPRGTDDYCSHRDAFLVTVIYNSPLVPLSYTDRSDLYCYGRFFFFISPFHLLSFRLSFLI